MFSLLQPGDTILGLGMKSGGHLTHGSRLSCSGKYFNAVSYGLDKHGLIDYEGVGELAERHRPKLIICGASAYPREIRFDLFRKIADSVNAILLADVSHIAGLIVAGVHPNPIDIAHVTTTSTYKQLFGPRGGLILMGRDWRLVWSGTDRTLEENIQRAIFPFFQGTPDLATIAAKARALSLVMTPRFAECSRRIVSNASCLARAFLEKRYELVTGGTDNHMVLLSLRGKIVTGKIAESALGECGIVVNRNMINGDTRAPSACSGLRFGTNTLSFRGMGEAEMYRCARLIDEVVTSLTVKSDVEYELPSEVRDSVRREVVSLCNAFPIRAC
jgi:glycine hydroxymethyltransferase